MRILLAILNIVAIALGLELGVIAWDIYSHVGKRLKERDAQVKALLDTAQATMNESRRSTTETLEHTRVVASELEHFTQKLNEHLFDDQHGIAVEIHGSLHDARALVLQANELTAAITRLAESGGKLSGQLSDALVDTAADVHSLIVSIDGQVKGNGAASQATLRQLERDLAKLDGILSDRGITNTIGHIDQATGSAADAAESTAIAMRQLREKSSLLKKLLMLLLR